MAGDFALLLLGTVSRGSGPFWWLDFCLLSLWDNCGSTPQNVDMFLVGCTLGLHPFTSSVHFVLAKSVPSFGFSLMSVEDLMCGPCYRVLQLAVQDSGNLLFWSILVDQVPVWGMSGLQRSWSVPLSSLTSSSVHIDPRSSWGHGNLSVNHLAGDLHNKV